MGSGPSNQNLFNQNQGGSNQDLGPFNSQQQGASSNAFGQPDRNLQNQQQQHQQSVFTKNSDWMGSGFGRDSGRNQEHSSFPGGSHDRRELNQDNDWNRRMRSDQDTSSRKNNRNDYDRSNRSEGGRGFRSDYESHRSDNDRRGKRDDDYNERRGNRGRREEEGDSWRRRDDDRSRRKSPEPFRRSPGASRRSQEVVKSAADRRMERELGSAIVKNPFDPSNRIGGRSR